MGIAENFIIIILAGLAAGIVASKIKIPPIVGYILAGAVLGPLSGFSPDDLKQIERLADIGVALLLFSIGLDFSFKELKAVKGIALIGTPLQVIAVSLFGWAAGMYLFGMGSTEALVFGMLISLSSTMVVLKTLMSRGLTGTLSSRVMIGILIIQDLAAIPMMLIIPGLGADGGIVPLLLTLGKAFIILFFIILIGMKLIPWILKFVARLNSREIFLISITAIGLGVGFITYKAGLSLAFGAFVAGMVINESDYSHQALSDIIPLRDIFGLVFFTSVGMMLDPKFITSNYTTILLLVLTVMAGKFVIFFCLSYLFKYKNIIPLAMGFGLCQIGEFSFVLASTGLNAGVVSKDFYSMILSVSVVTMILSPFASLLAAPVYERQKKYRKGNIYQTINLPAEGLRSHVIIAGGGRTGFLLGKVLSRTDFRFVIIEQDSRRFELCKEAGFPVIFGDAGQATVLEAAKLTDAALLILTIPYINTSVEISKYAKQTAPSLKIIGRADGKEQVEHYFRAGMYEVVQPELEAGIEMLRQAFVLLNVPLNKIYEFTDDLRKQQFRDYLRDNGEKIQLQDSSTPVLMEVGWYRLPADTSLAGKTIRELNIRSETGVSVVSIFRNEEYMTNPSPDIKLKPGDFIAVIGLPDNRNLFREKILGESSVGKNLSLNEELSPVQ